MSFPEPEMIPSFDGTELAVHRMAPAGAAAKTVVLLHGLFSSAEMNWFRFGHAQKLVEAGFDVILLDLRAHGHSAKPHTPEAYPADVLVKDVAALVRAMDLKEFDLVGFSLGARTAARAVISGLEPRRLVLAGMGLEGLAGWDRRADFFIDAIDRFDEIKRGDPAFLAVSFMKTMNVDRTAARLLLQSVDDTTPDQLAAITMPALVLCGREDRDNGSPQALAEALPEARLSEIPGTHMSSVAEAEMGTELVRFLAG